MNTQEITDHPSWPSGFRGAFFLVLILSVFFAYEVGNRHFADPDEGRYVEIPREMTVSGDYATPRLNGLKYFEKPPLFYWMQAGIIKVFGIGEVSMRLWTVIFAVIGCLSVFLVGVKHYSSTAGLISAGILATNALYYVHSRLIIIDLVLSVLMSGSLWCFFSAFVAKKRNSASSQKLLITSMYALSALACLTKGLIGVLLPSLVAFLWVAFTKNWKKTRDILYIPGILVFWAIFLPWHMLIASRNSDFLHFYFVVEHFLRYTTTAHCRYQPAWFFVPVLGVGLLPWTGFFLVAMKNSLRKSLGKNPENIFFTLWILGIFTFFSFSNSKLIPYILPVVQPIALLTGVHLVDAINSRSRDFTEGALATLVLFIFSFIAYWFFKSEIVEILEDSNAALLVNIFCGLILAMAVAMICALCSKVSRFATILFCLFLATHMMWILNKAAVFYQELKKPTTKRFAEIINLNKKDEDLVFCYKRYYQDFPIYLNSTVGVVDFVGELEFGANAEKNNQLISEDEFWKLWKATNKRIFLLLSRDNYREVFIEKNTVHSLLDFNEYFVVITNK
jgi:4-amino-4-deoxy-L-arabinose transferase-like glycosyltransferase